MQSKIGMAALAVSLALAGCGRGEGGEGGDGAVEAGSISGRGEIGNAAVAEAVASDVNTTVGSSSAAASAVQGAVPQEFVNAAAGAGAFIVESSRLAMQKQVSSGMRGYAEQMISAHGRSAAMLRTAAAGAATPVTPNGQLTPEYQAKMAFLAQRDGDRFESRFIQDHIIVHERTQQAMGNYARTGADPALKAHAAAMVPEIEGHLARARAVQAGTTTAQGRPAG